MLSSILNGVLPYVWRPAFSEIFSLRYNKESVVLY